MLGLWRHQFTRFLMVGCLNTGFSYGLYAVFLWCNLNYVIANGLAFLISILFSFRTQGALVFRNSEPRLLLRFALAWGLIYLFNIGLIAVLMGAGFNAYVAGALALVPVILLSFVVQKFVVFGALVRPTMADTSQPSP